MQSIATPQRRQAAHERVCLPTHPAHSTPEESLPFTRGTLFGELAYFPDHDDPRLEVAEARLRVTCPYCGRQHTHGWTLSGERRTEIRMAHCHAGLYRVRPALVSCAPHEHSPYRRIARPSRRRVVVREPWPARPEGVHICDWFAWRGGLVMAAMEAAPRLDYWQARDLAARWAALAVEAGKVDAS